MSAEAMGWVWRHSPHKGSTFAVHLALADSVNDQHENLFWMAKGNLATKARMSRQTALLAVAELVATGFVEVVDEPKGQPVAYRFLFPDVPVVFESRRSRGVGNPYTPTRGVSSDLTGGVGSSDTNPREPNNPSGYQDPADVTGSREADPVDDDTLADDADLHDIRAHRARHRSRAS